MGEHSGHSGRLARRIMWGMAAGMALGLIARLAAGWMPRLGPTAEWVVSELLDPVGQIFLRLLFFVVVPLVFGSLALGVVQLGDLRKLGPLAGRTFLLFAVNMAISVALGLLIMNAVKPGLHMNREVRAELTARYQAEARTVQERAEQQPSISLRSLVEMFMPRNVVRAVVDFQILPLILFALLVGCAGTQLRPELHRRLRNALEILTELMTRIVHYAMLLAPFGVAALLAGLVMRSGLDVLGAIGVFVLCVLGGLAIHLFGTLSLMLRLLTRRSPREFFRAIRPVLVTAFSTSSSNATLPSSIQISREELGVSESTAGFVLPLGATMNMSGTALYEGCVVLFVAQVYGGAMPLGSQAVLLVLTVLSAVAGIPGASLPLIAALLTHFHLPVEGLALILGADRVMDMARTVLNVAADLVTACIVDERASPAA